jgi:hypothetical protein
LKRAGPREFGGNGWNHCEFIQIRLVVARLLESRGILGETMPYLQKHGNL